MQISGIQKFTMIDYPGKLACTIFTLGCNFRCPFCHNADFVLPKKVKKQTQNLINIGAFMNFLDERKKRLEGVVVCGGEPTIHSDLDEFIEKIKSKGFSVKLDSNGSNPKMLKKLLDANLIDYVAMDIKHSFDKYLYLDGVDGKFVDKIKRSISILKNSKIDYEFRSTVIDGYHTSKDIESIAQSLEGGKKYFLQKLQTGETLDRDFDGQEVSNSQMKKFQSLAQNYIKTFLRG